MLPSPDDTTRRQLYEAGLQVRAAVVGEEYVTRVLADTTEFSRPMQELVTEYCWGAVWTRPGLSPRTRSMITLAMLTALNRPTEFGTHVRGALANGVSPGAIQEVLLHTAVYAGVPAAVESFRIAGQILAERSDD
ncbi:carboxymuconolactone decarboxylase family protein [Nocardia sp. NBC_01730]|uniref:carboxymuconolactone decarboxylase family protein n=1 Tax=Nocardia sp. NBC_01730 TaxID=2975998 RepID=UPI002E13322B|nr:carboxymuconolactone decarboxylase family protein [Nocardia sp. NBC_01730]